MHLLTWASSGSWRRSTHPSWVRPEFDRSASPKYLAAMLKFYSGHLRNYSEASEELGRTLARWEVPKGLLDKAAAIQYHWQCRDNRRRSFRAIERCTDVPGHTVILACDFGELWGCS